VPKPTDKDLLPLAYFRSIPSKRCGVLKRVEDKTVFEDADLDRTTADAARRLAGVHAKATPIKCPSLSRSRRPESSRSSEFNDMNERGGENYPADAYLDTAPTATTILRGGLKPRVQPVCYYTQTYECQYPPREKSDMEDSASARARR